jgi:hypothetical protein
MTEPLARARPRTFSRFKQLKERGIVSNEQTLSHLRKHAGFPAPLQARSQDRALR